MVSWLALYLLAEPLSIIATRFGPFVIGFVLAPLGEAKLRSGLMMTAGGIEPLFTRPLSTIFLVAAVILLAWPFVSQWRARRRAAANRKTR